MDFAAGVRARKNEIGQLIFRVRLVLPGAARLQASRNERGRQPGRPIWIAFSVLALPNGFPLRFLSLRLGIYCRHSDAPTLEEPVADLTAIICAIYILFVR